MQCCCEEGKGSSVRLSGAQVDLDLLNEVLAHYREQEGSLVTVLQKAQEVYGFLPLPS